MLKAEEKKQNYKKLAIVLVILFLIVAIMSTGIMPINKNKAPKKNKSKKQWYFIIQIISIKIERINENFQLFCLLQRKVFINVFLLL